MSQDFNDPEIFADFIVEAKEHLETIEPNLLELEKSPDNLALCNAIFRPMHSLKGASGFLGLNTINRLAHKAENIMEELRKGEMPVTSEIMDVILSSTDALRQLVDNLESTGSEGDVEVEHLVQTIDALLAGEMTPQALQQQATGAEPDAQATQEQPEDQPAEEPADEPEHQQAAEPEPEETPEEVLEEALGQPPEAASDEDEAAADASNDASAQEPRELPPYTLTTFGEGHLNDFLEEAHETISNLNSGLLELEKDPKAGGELVNDLFRYFHNLKGNSGIIGFKELNSLTHEAETLLNRVRKDEIESSHALIDLLLSAVDLIEALVSRVEVESGQVTPLDIDELVTRLQVAVNEGVVEPPKAEGGQTEAKAAAQNLQNDTNGPGSEDSEAPVDADEAGDTGDETEKAWSDAVDQAVTESEQEKDRDRQAGIDAVAKSAQQPSATKAEEPPAAASPTQQASAAPAPEATAGSQSQAESDAPGVDPEDVAVFESTVRQQLDNIDLALKELQKDADQKDYVDSLYRSLTTLQNSSGYMGFEDTKNYAERTAKLVDQARKTGIGFEPLLDIMRQEVSILSDMLYKVLDDLKGGEAPAAESKPAAEPKKEPAAPAPAAGGKPAPKAAETPASKEAAAEKPAPKAAEKPAAKPPQAPAPKPEAKPAPKPADKPAPKPEAKPASKPAPKPAEKPAAKPAATPEQKPTPAAQPEKASPPAGKGTPPAAAAAAQQQKPKVSSTIRVDHEKLDHLMNLIGELIINRNRYSMLARGLEEGHDVNEIAQSLTETTYAMARISDDLQDTIMKVRMVPVQTVFSRFPRLVRDLSRKSNKKVELITEGEETELDKSVVEVIGDPLVHLIRNSVDHGIENEEDRAKTGKDPVGKVYLRAYHRGNSVAIEVEDDGKGINPEKMRESAIKKGIISAEEAKNLDDREALELIFAPGFSTAEKVTDISGRGVGMDVVRTNIKNLKGSVNINSEVGKFTRFTLSLPLTLAIIDALMVTVADQTFAIPLDAVSETTKIEASRLTDVNNRKAVTLRGEVLGIVDLRELLEMPPREESEILSVLVIHDNERRLGIIVDRLLERQEIVIKSLGSYLGDQKGFSGATIMGDGSVVLILDPHEVYIMATSKAI